MNTFYFKLLQFAPLSEQLKPTVPQWHAFTPTQKWWVECYLVPCAWPGLVTNGAGSRGHGVARPVIGERPSYLTRSVALWPLCDLWKWGRLHFAVYSLLLPAFLDIICVRWVILRFIKDSKWPIGVNASMNGRFVYRCPVIDCRPLTRVRRIHTNTHTCRRARTKAFVSCLVNGCRTGGPLRLVYCTWPMSRSKWSHMRSDTQRLIFMQIRCWPGLKTPIMRHHVFKCISTHLHLSFMNYNHPADTQEKLLAD